MICLDTNYLIMGLVAESREAKALVEWNGRGERLVTSTVCWYEFLCGPVHDDQVAMMKVLLHEVLSFDPSQAAEAARLFNAVGRRRPLRIDAMVAASAIIRNAPLATGNPDDFRPFVPFGLRLAAMG